MRVAFYAPLKPPDHQIPSGDRRVARLLMSALGHAGHRVVLASRLRAFDGAGDPAVQERIRQQGEAEAAQLMRRYRAAKADSRPQVWFTYHPYYKAPDWIGPAVSAALDIPYVIAEASHAPKRAEGPWAAGHAAAAAAIMLADRVLCLNPTDMPGLLPLVLERGRLVSIPPFLDAAIYRAAERGPSRAALAARLGLALDAPWLIAVAMMRRDDKLRSYQLLGSALQGLVDRDWRLVVVGDGPARAEVEAALAPLGARVAWAGAMEPDALPEVYAAMELCVWPAIGEAYGMALLEAQASGLAVVAGAHGGVPAIVADGRSGLLTPPGDADAFAAAVARLLDDANLRIAMGAAARDWIARGHDIAAAAELLDAALRGAVAERRRMIG